MEELLKCLANMGIKSQEAVLSGSADSALFSIEGPERIIDSHKRLIEIISE